VSGEQDIQWKRLSIEAVAIIVSILLAFAIDAWWQDRQERSLEQDMLLGLQEEYQDHRAVLGMQRDFHILFLSSVEMLLDACARGHWVSNEITVDRAMADLLTPMTTDLGEGVLQSLISAGKLEYLSDKRLRYELAEWGSIMGELADDQLTGSQLVKQLIAPYLTRKGVPIGGMSYWDDNDPPDSVRQLRNDPEAMARLFSDPEFRTIIEVRYGFMIHALAEFDGVVASIESILVKIDASLSK
jgi:hypothetical protein